ncbi:MAG TPA: pyroglutamyl-peptidase I, partial [Stellaceae bacterium]|nr:pyroglutamyl-peptidase I [Stellaceae bacterium]
MKALVTGFEPFGGESVNPSSAALAQLRRALGPLEVATAVLPTAFGRTGVALAAALDRHAPDIVLAVGQAGGRSALSLERIAINLLDAGAPDNDGALPVDEPVVDGGPAAYFTTLPIKAAVAALRHAGLPATVSLSAGSFVCNQALYLLLHRAAIGGGFRAGFLHVPYLPQQAAARAEMPSLALEHVVQGIEIVLAVAAERAADTWSSPALAGEGWSGGAAP